MFNKLSKKNRTILIASVALFSVFIISYITTDMYLDKKNKVQESEEERKVTTTSDDDLDGNIKILLYTGENQDKEFVVSEYEKEKNIDKLSYDELLRILKNEGYQVSSKGDKTISFRRDKDTSLEEGRYYLGFKDQILTIFKADSHGKLEYVEYAPHLQGDPITKADIVSSMSREIADKIENNEISSDTLEGIMEEASDY